MKETKQNVPAERSQMAKKRTNGEGTIRQRDNGLWAEKHLIHQF